MSSEGWIKVYRKIQDNPLWLSEKFTRGQAWIDLLLLANHSSSFFYKRGVKVEVERGQLARSEVELADRWKWSRTKVKKFIKDLEKEQQVVQQNNNITQIVTILNYDEYQKKEQQTVQQKSSRSAAEKHIQECKEGKECKEKKDIVGQKPRPQIPFNEIVSFLNEKAGKDFKSTTSTTKAHIRARWSEGYRVDDFKTVIESKYDDWKSDPEMQQYLRPQTLFGTKFESYLQSAKETIQPKSTWVKNDIFNSSSDVPN